MNSFYINNKKIYHDLENEKISSSISLLDYLESIGIIIPHYCYDRRLSIAGNCRMCMVEVKGSPKPVIACATPLSSCLRNASEIYTHSPMVKKARESVLEFLLLNHPLDCPICDQGGECDLQDQSFFYGTSKKRFYESKRVVSNKNLGPIVKTVMTRCIHCTRCVRFAEEVAGVDDLGMFGRGSSSEIGTYIEKNFQSELSGNVIDLCPVGALTSKPYAFVKRNWELKTISSIDFTDGFSSSIQLSLKNNKIVKVQPGFNRSLKDFNWISDKARFAFEGSFSLDRYSEGYVQNSTSNIKKNLSWTELLEEICSILYFQDIINSYRLNSHKLIVVIDNNISLEALTMLIMLSRSVPIIDIKKSEGIFLNLDLESNFLINSNFDTSLYSSNLCLLIGVNTRYEGLSLNLKLRGRIKKGNFRIVSLGPTVDLTYPVETLGLTLKNLLSIVSGNHIFCQDLVKDSNPIIIVGSEVYKRKDGLKIFKILNSLKFLLKAFYPGWNNIHLLSSAINEVGVNYLRSIDSLSENDLLSSFGLYYVNISSCIPNIRKVINLKCSNYINIKDMEPKTIIEHNAGRYLNNSSVTRRVYGSYSYINLPNSNFFESSGSYLNAQGQFNHVTKSVRCGSLVKEDWQIFNKILKYSLKISFLNNRKFITFNSSSSDLFKLYVGFICFPSTHLSSSNLNFMDVTMNSNFSLYKKKFKLERLKIYNTPLKSGIVDFYIGGKDFYSSNSLTMVKCSKLFRNSFNNFLYLSKVL